MRCPAVDVQRPKVRHDLLLRLEAHADKVLVAKDQAAALRGQEGQLVQARGAELRQLDALDLGADAGRQVVHLGGAREQVRERGVCAVADVDVLKVAQVFHLLQRVVVREEVRVQRGAVCVLRPLAQLEGQRGRRHGFRCGSHCSVFLRYRMLMSTGNFQSIHMESRMMPYKCFGLEKVQLCRSCPIADPRQVRRNHHWPPSSSSSAATSAPRAVMKQSRPGQHSPN